jgi:hypothetical protein
MRSSAWAAWASKRCTAGGIRENPEELRRKREFLIVDHTECWQFDDPEMARKARKYRKRKKLEENLAAQRMSWQGRRI